MNNVRHINADGMAGKTNFGTRQRQKRDTHEALVELPELVLTHSRQCTHGFVVRGVAEINVL
jgi:RNase P/RNase MRP subunit p30